ncbi:response regulator [Thalassolituus pacificus]|uniref:histidine kinase n=1 Tax=Thalassolituus pacificus TaxID=2975440 RepID=A0A9X2WGV7_9GAMM|nr:hybrid sensor histidine kinase/response regulator [Thalassolituus pacificus]MCT7359830.1 response regulator [Thalassolituus pacificus]
MNNNEAVLTSVSGDAFLPERIVLLVVDDDEAVLQVTRLVLSRFRYKSRSLEILEASSAAQAKATLALRPDIAVILLDVVMESDDAGLRLVEHIRHELNNHHVRILLRTGQAGYAPERQVVQDYDINDYLVKSDATQSRLFLSLTAAIRSFSDILRAEELARRIAEAEHQRQLADRASLAKTDFLAHMSHEIRTPLNGIAGIVELLDDTGLSSEQAELLRDLRYVSSALLGIVNDVLDVAKIEAGKLELNVHDFHLPQLLEKVAAIFVVGMQQKAIRFQVEQGNDLPQWVRGDAQRIQQILINYLSNAYKFTPQGGRITLRVSCVVAADGYELIAEVDDNGKGIRAERLADIFNAYEQESAQTASHYGGTGLGLSLSRSLAMLMSGCVGADSEPGYGSRFWLRVPLERGEAPVVDETAADPLAADALAGWVILISEDDPTSQKIIRKILEQQGARVEVFADGQQLLDSGLYHTADVIVLDYHMPVLDGPSTARRLRELDYQGPLLALTAGIVDSEREACLQAGMNDVQGKPLDKQRLINWLLNAR